MHESMSAKFNRLPMWAQREITRLENDIASLEAKLAAGPENSDTSVVGYSSPDRPLGTSVTVRYQLEPGSRSGYVECGIVPAESTFLRVRALRVNTSETMCIIPTASNSALILDRKRV